jgi:hypothetical protein
MIIPANNGPIAIGKTRLKPSFAKKHKRSEAIRLEQGAEQQPPD